MLPSSSDRPAFGKKGLRVDHWVLEGIIGKPGEQGEVWLARSSEAKPLKFAIKILKDRTLRREFKALAKVTHPNIVRVFASGELTTGGAKHPYYVMEHLGTEVLPLNKALEQISPDNKMAVCLRALIETAFALEEVHKARLVHGDLKPSNILVGGYLGSFPTIKLIDFGFATSPQSGDRAGRLPDKSTSKRRTDKCATPQHADVWQLAYSIERILDELEKECPPLDTGACPWPIDSADYAGIKTLVREWASHGVSSAAECGRTKDFFDGLRSFIRRYDLNHLAPSLRGAVRYLRIPELATAAHLQPAYEAIRLPPRQLVLYTERIKRLITHPDFGVLRFTRQLGFTHLAYPGALGTRFEHSLGVFHLGCRFLTRMSVEESFRAVCKEPDEGLKFLLAALLHDIGHFPFAHQIEELSIDDFSEKELRRLSSFVTRQKAHKRRGKELVGSRLRPVLRELFALTNADVDDIVQLAFARRGELESSQRASVAFLHTLLDAAVDLDKLDYVERDAHHCGVPYGNYLDIERLLETMRVVRIEDSGRPSLAFDWRGIGCLEQLATARHQMYANVYWHRAVRSATTMFKHAFVLYGRLVDRRQTLERIFFGSSSDDSVLSAIIDMAGVPKSERASREARAVKRLMTVVSGYDRVLYKQVFDADYTDNEVKRWGQTYRSQRETAKSLFLHLSRLNLLSPEADELREHNILIDCRADEPPDFSRILIVNHRGKPVPLGGESRIILDLKENFQRQACRVRVFVNPTALAERLRDRSNQEEVREAITSFAQEED